MRAEGAQCSLLSLAPPLDRPLKDSVSPIESLLLSHHITHTHIRSVPHHHHPHPTAPSHSLNHDALALCPPSLSPSPHRRSTTTNHNNKRTPSHERHQTSTQVPYFLSRGDDGFGQSVQVSNARHDPLLQRLDRDDWDTREGREGRWWRGEGGG